MCHILNEKNKFYVDATDGIGCSSSGVGFIVGVSFSTHHTRATNITQLIYIYK